MAGSNPSAAGAPRLCLSQHGRASMEFLGSAQVYSSGTLRDRAREQFTADAEAARLDAEHRASGDDGKMRDRIARARAIADTIPVFRLERFVQRWVAEEVFSSGITAIEERRERFEPFATAPLQRSSGGTLELDPTLEEPKYWQVEWHLEPGGWDGYDLSGPLFAFAIGPLVFARGGFAAVAVGDNLRAQRDDAVSQFPKKRYDRIYEPGCGNANTSSALHKAFPDAELVASDISPVLLKGGHRMAEAMGIPVHLKQRDVLDTREPDESFDAVLTYALHHEMPPKANRQLFGEMYRIMKPGADIVISDPPPFRAVSLFQAILLDWETTNRGEPFFSAVLESNLEEQLRDAGFERVEAYALNDRGYPWITRATKPAGAVQ